MLLNSSIELRIQIFSFNSIISALIEGLSTVLKSWDTTQNDKSDFSEIDILSEANDSFDKSGDRNKINDLFKGQTITTIICNSCYEITRVYEEFIAHTVEIPESSNGRYSSTDLSSCFAKTMEYSYFDKSNSFYWRKWNKVASINKAIKINRLPKLLIIVIKRFKTEGKYAEKDWTNIELPYEDFDLYPFLHDECLILNPCTKYHLYGVSLHSGGIGGGHYVANVKNISGDGKWYNCDDSYTGVIEEPQHSGSSPYVLFYYRDDLVD